MTVPETNRDGRELGRRKLVERFSLTGHRTLVIGGSAGIGFAIARGMAQAGADVAIVARDAGRLDAACRELAVYGGRVVPVRADVSDAAQRSEVVASAARQLGDIDILVNNAAAKPSLGPLEQCPEETWDLLMDVNVKAYLMLSRSVIPGMRAGGWGRIINVTSVTGLKARSGMGEYAVTKAAEIMLTRALAVEVGGSGITVNALAPILTRSDFSARQLDSPSEVERVTSMQAIKRIGEPDDVVGASLLVASDAGRFMTGTTLVVDGGALA